MLVRLLSGGLISLVGAGFMMLSVWESNDWAIIFGKLFSDK
jgi:hypothetical protein